MDRRQRKTKNAIFAAFCRLLSHREYARVTVGDIIAEADVGRATFYAHFETKDGLLLALCEELFAHLFGTPDGAHGGPFADCHEENAVFLHLLRHLAREDEAPLARLLSSPNNTLFVGYFKEGLVRVLLDKMPKDANPPAPYAARFLAAAMVESLLWWLENRKIETPERVAAYLDEMLGQACLSLGALDTAGEENVAN